MKRAVGGILKWKVHFTGKKEPHQHSKKQTDKTNTKTTKDCVFIDGLGPFTGKSKKIRLIYRYSRKESLRISVCFKILLKKPLKTTFVS